MRQRNAAAVGIVAALFLACSTAVVAADAAKAIDGEWTPVEIERGGKKQPAPENPLGNVRIVITGGKYRAMLADRLVMEATLTTDATKTPKTFEMRGPPDRKGRAMVNRGIYEIDGKGHLRMCFQTGEDAKPPKSFDTKANPGSQLTVYKPAK